MVIRSEVKGEPMLIYGIVLTLVCLATLLWPDRRAAWIERRIAEGDNRFFEEQRSYEAYPWLRDRRRIRVVGAIGTVFGLAFCILQFYRD